MFEFMGGGGGFSSSSSANTGRGGEIGGYQYGGINNGLQVPEWLPVAVVVLAVVLLVKK